jgi:hypothetical protein
MTSSSQKFLSAGAFIITLLGLAGVAGILFTI